MFIFSVIVDTFAVECDQARNDFEELKVRLRDVLSAKFVDRIILEYGLCVALMDLVSVEAQPILGPNDGRPSFKVQFETLLFSPVKDEIISGRICASDATGLRISCQVMRDIRVPAHMLQEPSAFDAQAGLWYWKVDIKEEATGMTNTKQLWYELNGLVRLRVCDVIYNKECSIRSSEAEAAESFAPMLIIVRQPFAYSQSHTLTHSVHDRVYLGG